MKGISEVRTLAGRELRSYFASPIAYIVLTAFLVPTGAFFFWDFFYINQAEMRKFFQVLPLIFTFFIPAITMKLFAEEKQTGSDELLMTLPVSSSKIVVGKFLAAMIFILFMLVPTLFYAVTVILVGSPDPGPMAGGYIGIVFLGAAYVSICLLVSSLTRNQIVAFILGWLATFSLWLIDKIVMFIPAPLRFISWLGTDYHFQNIARGIVDSRDLIYFLSMIIISLLLTTRAVEERR